MNYQGIGALLRRTPLRREFDWRCGKEMSAEFRRLVKANPQAVNAKGEAGWRPLMYAALYGGADAIKLLIERGAFVNERNDAGGTALMYAVDDFEKTKLLLERGADPNLRSGEGRTALLIAVANSGSYSVVKLLLEKGADAKLNLPDGRGALGLAVNSLDPQVLQLLLARGANKPLPLSYAIMMGCQECFEVMLQHAQPRRPQRGAAGRRNLRQRPDDQHASRARSASAARNSAGGSTLSSTDSSRHDSDFSEPWSQPEP